MMNATQLIERLKYLYEVMAGYSEIAEEDCEKSNAELYDEWKASHEDWKRQGRLIPEE